MLKKERLMRILDQVNRKGIITINDLTEKLNVSDMTIRRDLDQLNTEGKLTRIHGGAQAISKNNKKELSNIEKQTVHILEKEEIAKLAVDLVDDGDSIFIGPGTTLEALAKVIHNKHLRIVTNSLPVFDILKNKADIDLILLGGEFRSITGAFVGPLTQKCFENMFFSKTFVSANGINNQQIATYSDSEGIIQQLALDNAEKKFLLADSTKFNKFDFYDFYNLEQLDLIITDSHLSKENYSKFSAYVPIHHS
ncbi:DeoR/GlpR family DNA-binding transcription regulator [Streptococcus halotolerans]|uniref:DeoR/GlpR family DNA-binding transcription regulator n=1 Tax=Streptococcus halotolerans TaxID=1814128 RepID=UPI0007874EF7|nr:DeoR/GlpR family DNA-binding transcription regulator [Streptococcus halotolerans]